MKSWREKKPRWVALEVSDSDQPAKVIRLNSLTTSAVIA